VVGACSASEVVGALGVPATLANSSITANANRSAGPRPSGADVNAVSTMIEVAVSGSRIMNEL